jgi:hypothetical protein
MGEGSEKFGVAAELVSEVRLGSTGLPEFTFQVLPTWSDP